MTFTPSAYADKYDGKFWVFITTPSGVVARLVSAYLTREGAEAAIVRYGLKRIDPPKAPPVATINRSNTTPR